MRVFISHSSKDKSKIDEFVNAVKYLGGEVFYSSKNETNSIEAGEDFYKRILKEISESDLIIAMISEKFYESIPSQIEMGMAYALEKSITPIIIDKNSDYSNLLKGIFTSNNRAYSIYDKEQVIEVLSKITENTTKRIMDIVKCSEIIEKSVRDIEGSLIKKEVLVEIEGNNLLQNTNIIMEFINDGEFNINECLFLKYMWKKRKYNLEYAWQLGKGAQEFQFWVNSYYELDGDTEEVYKNTIDHFNSLELLDEVEYTSSNNVKLYRLKLKYIRQLTSIFNTNPEIIDNECNKVIVRMPF
ncbi:toll/interleukin-1 receptor domain-containing protein [Clostridium gasigenes]|uniref:toll/interleukin-1 receptor domain-containing protein n=1 Tax=Clostridium gasigenes TaxID=94869 RepID=UPI0014383953|nr:toll/interleukin-1 receptor domain-containing protein [Clostridium gasigenes]NKF05694.1 toll/interleukin-1 receptor domain-containing protein [Clostridium gasigenes]QSW19128.1 toll/interleukin-1 receptor domain-containing protein [Clostridium gasigenes]